MSNWWRYPFELIDRRWPTDRVWCSGGRLANAARVLCYELCYGCPPCMTAAWVVLLGSRVKP